MINQLEDFFGFFIRGSPHVHPMDTYQVDVEPRVLFQVLGWQPSHTFAGDIAAYYADYCRLGKDLAREFFGPDRMENGGWSLLSIYIYIYVFLCPG
jgi:hypothetical protein